ncbi:CoA-transferase family III domain-containing protein [Amylocarpus encephaloides]|uniref:CoA-transferase family III domain-containing protein n=1 Tax=Amylocarpus encephaloides TaxID=45428 RepID=A0A9P8C5K3_9HELO|nr:CoA-transferase family III domain-containing protein [Amylocarpus encephaloides]
MSSPPLSGLRVLEFAGLAPGPFAGLLLADNGASVLRIDRSIPNVTHASPSAELPPPTSDLLSRHKSSIAVDLKSAAGVAFVKSLVKHTDIVIDPFRPGVLEKLGLGPDTLLDLNPKVLIGRMTGFRRDGKYKDMAGHDINYIAVSGALAMLGRKGEKPLPPGNILGDFAGGGATLFQGILLALLARTKSGKGQVVEANMVDGSSYLATFPRMLTKTPMWSRPRGENTLDSGCPYYDTYETKDGKYMAVGALEPQFFKELLKGLGLAGKGIENTREDSSTWPGLKETITNIFLRKTRSEWELVFDKTDACCTPVLDYIELEQDHSREGDQRPAVTLRDTPSLALSKGFVSRDPSTGQGVGVEGGSYHGTALYPGQGGEEVLSQWLGWKRGKDFGVENGGLVKIPLPKL